MFPLLDVSVTLPPEQNANGPLALMVGMAVAAHGVGEVYSAEPEVD